MSTLPDGHVLGTFGYVKGKCRRCDKIMCNKCPLKHEGRTRSDGWDALRAFARTRTNIVRRPANQGRICIYISDNKTWIHSMDTTIRIKDYKKVPWYGHNNSNEKDQVNIDSKTWHTCNHYVPVHNILCIWKRIYKYSEVSDNWYNHHKQTWESVPKINNILLMWL